MKNSLKNQTGQVTLFLATMIVVLVMFTALTIDMGHVLVVRNQLQNAADATALQGAGYLYPALSTGAPNWSLAKTNATSSLPNNKVDNIALSNATITTGYWNLTSATLKATTITPGVGDVPAVKVTISRSAGNNGGPLSLYFGFIFGYNTVSLNTTAIAVQGSPTTVKAGDLFPIAMAQGTYNTYWNSATNSPLIDPSTGQPYIFQISQGSQGGWNTFLQQANSSPAIISLITSGNPTSLSIGQSIWFSTGVKTDIYSHVPTNVNVVAAVTSNSTAGTFEPIVAFAGLHIIDTKGGSSKYVEVQFTTNVKITDGEPGGINYGVYTPARLVY